MAAAEVGCEHYVRNCRLKAPCCGKFYVCRLCHDAEEEHQMDRFQVKEIQCIVCSAVQEAQQSCKECNVKFGEYYCGICHLFDKDKKQYHCTPCGICRIGPREKYFHCEKCNLCLACDLQGNHKCVENVSRQNCSVCMEDIHTSRVGAEMLPCGHLLHKTCFLDMCRTGAYRCPLCMHSVCDMQAYWEERDKEIAQTPMPTEYRDATVKVHSHGLVRVYKRVAIAPGIKKSQSCLIICNDCQAHCTVPFHVLGLKCSGCGSYNTAQNGGLIQAEQGQDSPPDP